MRSFWLLFLTACATRYEAVGPDCYSEAACGANATCRVTECIANGALREDDTCTDDVQCGSGLVCPPAVFQCVRPCPRIFESTEECGEQRVCAPHFLLSNKGRFVGGVCVSKECAKPADCNDGGRLVAPSRDNRCVLGLCMSGCVVGLRVADTSLGVDTCVSLIDGTPAHCGPLPSGHNVCVPAGSSQVGEACSVYPSVDAPDACDVSALTCDAGVCVQH